MPAPTSTRLLAASTAACVLLGAAWPLREALSTGAVPGAGPDVVSTLWGTWWFTQVGPLAAFGGWTDLVNHPAGAIGALLSPATALSWALSRPLLGDGGAMSFTVLVQVVGLAGLCALLARRVGVGTAGACVAALVVTAARYLPYGAGEGSVVAITALPLPLGLWALVGIAGVAGVQAEPRGGGAGATLLLAACMPALALENPYLAPVLPAATGLVLLASLRPGRPTRRRLALAVALALGSAGILLVSWLFGRAAAPDYPVEMVGSTVRLLGVDLPVVDMPWARASPADLFWPGAIEWTVDVDSARDNPGGGRYLGLAGLLLSAVATALAPRRAGPWAALLLVGLLLGLGSMLGPVGGPFLYLNALLDAVARPLTQPTRFLVVALVGMAVLAGLAVDRLVARFGLRAAWAAALLVVLDGAVVGGPSLRLPALPLPAVSCADALPDGAVLTWPTDALGGWPANAQLLQLAHERPAAHRGIASWRLLEPKALDQLRELGWDRHTQAGIDSRGLTAEGYRLVLVESGTPAEERSWLELSLGPAIATCDGLVVHDLALAPGTRSPAPRSGSSAPRGLAQPDAQAGQPGGSATP